MHPISRVGELQTGKLRSALLTTESSMDVLFCAWSRSDYSFACFVCCRGSCFSSFFLLSWLNFNFLQSSWASKSDDVIISKSDITFNLMRIVPLWHDRRSCLGDIGKLSIYLSLRCIETDLWSQQRTRPSDHQHSRKWRQTSVCPLRIHSYQRQRKTHGVLHLRLCAGARPAEYDAGQRRTAHGAASARTVQSCAKGCWERHRNGRNPQTADQPRCRERGTAFIVWGLDGLLLVRSQRP